MALPLETTKDIFLYNTDVINPIVCYFRNEKKKKKKGGGGGGGGGMALLLETTKDIFLYNTDVINPIVKLLFCCFVNFFFEKNEYGFTACNTVRDIFV